MDGGRLSLPSGCWPDGNHEVDGGYAPNVSDSVFLLAGGKARGPGPQSVLLPLDGELHGTFPDQPELAVFVSMGRVRGGSGLEHGLMSLDLFSSWALTFDDLPVLCVAALALGDGQILELECNGGEGFALGKRAARERRQRQQRAQGSPRNPHR